MIIVPENILFQYVNIALNFIRDDYNAQSDKTKSYLLRVAAGAGIEKYDYLTQAPVVFIKEIDDPRAIGVNMMFNMKKEGVPSIHIMMPSENTTNGNGLGIDEGYADEIVDDNTSTVTTQYTRRFTTTLNIVITSDNSNEVILIYHVLRAMMISLMSAMHLAGLEGAKLGGNDLQIKTDLVPKNIFLKSINISCEYEVTVPDIFTHPILRNLIIDQTPVNS